MARQTRDLRIVPDHPNHLILRGNNRRKLFSYVDDRKMFLRMLSKASEEHRCVIHALCLMKNHVHELTTPPSVDDVSGCVKQFAQRYAQVRNAKRGGSGKLFEQRFYSKPIANERHMIAATVYIDANPVRAGLVSDALDYPWSTYAMHVGSPEKSAIPKSLWTPSAWYLSLGRSPAQSARRYRQLFEGYLGTPSLFAEFEELHGIHGLDVEPTYRVTRPDGSRAAESQTASRTGTISRR